MENEITLRVTAPHFVAGLVVRDGRIVVAAPILRWSKGKSQKDFESYCKRKGWKVELGLAIFRDFRDSKDRENPDGKL